jgi:hypothetical protein
MYKITHQKHDGSKTGQKQLFPSKGKKFHKWWQ